MYKFTAILVTGILAGLAQADPKCNTGPVHPTKDNLKLFACVDNETKNPQWHEWECDGKHFQYWSNGSWGSPGDCLGGCTPCLEGAAIMGAEWVKCDQEKTFAQCAVGWSPDKHHFCEDRAPCTD